MPETETAVRPDPIQAEFPDSEFTKPIVEEAPASQPEPSQPVTEPSVTEPAEAEPAHEEAEAAPQGEEDPEVVQAIAKLYGPKIAELPEERERRERQVQAEVDRRLAELRAQPAAHAEVIEHRTLAMRDLELVRQLAKEAADRGEVPDPEAVQAVTFRHGYNAARAERFGAFETARAVIEHLTAPEMAALSKALGEREAQEARTPIDQFYNEGVTQFRRFINAGTQSGRLTQGDVQTQERAFGEYMSRAAQALIELGKRVGAAQVMRDARERAEAQLIIEKHNALQQARAEVQAKAPVPPETPTGAPLPEQPALTAERLRGSWRDDLKLLEADRKRG